MELLKIAVSSLGSVVLLFILTKIIGNREMSQLTMFDYINSITIGSIAAEMATSIENDFTKPLVAMIFYSLVVSLIAFITSKSMKARDFLTGKSLLLLEDGSIYYSNFKKAKLDINEFLTQCRIAGYTNISDLFCAIMEPNGKISFIPKSNKRLVNTEDMGLNVEQEKRIICVIIDGNILEANLKETKNSEKWLREELKKQKIKDISNIFLATCDSNNNISVYMK